MAKTQHPKPLIHKDDLTEPYIKPGHTLPGYTVDRLLEQDKVDEARQELERLLLEGLDSGNAVEVTPQFWHDLRTRLRRQASTRKLAHSRVGWSSIP